MSILWNKDKEHDGHSDLDRWLEREGEKVSPEGAFYVLLGSIWFFIIICLIGVLLTRAK